MNKDLISFSISQKLKGLINKVKHYEQSYLPELREYTGFTQHEHLDMAKEELERFRVGVNDYNLTGNELFLDFTPTEKANYIRLYAIEQREMAADYSSNPYIKVRALRRCVFALTELKRLVPELDVYSNHWLASRKIINIKQVTQ